jgi:hypothetical protein
MYNILTLYLIFTCITFAYSQENEVELNPKVFQYYIDNMGDPRIENSCSDNNSRQLTTIATYNCNCDDEFEDSEVDLSGKKLWTIPNKFRLVRFGGYHINDSNMFVKDEDDLGMTASFGTKLSDPLYSVDSFLTVLRV